MVATTLTDWHKRLGHVAKDTIIHMAKNRMVEGLKITDHDKFDCIACCFGKSKRTSHASKSTPKSQIAGQVLHFDTVGPIPRESIGGASYFVLCKDECSGYRRVEFMARKDEIPNRVKKIISQSKIDTGNDVLEINTDNGTEFVNKDLSTFLSSKGIIHNVSATYTPEQNGYIERDIQTVSDAARTMRIEADLDKRYWAEAVNTAVYVLNRSVGSTKRKTTPYEAWFGQKPLLNNLHRFGQQAIVHIEKVKRDKLDPKGTLLMFVGYTSVYNTFRFVDPETDDLIISCNAHFLDSDGNPTAKESSQRESSDKSDSMTWLSFTTSPEISSTQQVDSRVNLQGGKSPASTPSKNNVSDISDLSQFESTHDVSDSDSHHTYDIVKDNNEKLIDFTSPIITEMREAAANMPPETADQERLSSLRPRNNRPTYTNWKVNVATADATLDDSYTPRSFKDAMKQSDCDKWREAMKEELAAFDKCQVWTLVARPQEANIVTNRWVLKVKRTPDGKIDRYRARLVARGFSQVEGVDYNETYAPVASAMAIRLLFAHAAIESLHISQFDVKTAFLYGTLDEEIFMEQPDGFNDGSGRVCKLKRSLYGLKQAPRMWNREFTKFLTDMGLDVSKEDPCIFFSHEPRIIIALYVDDGIIFARNQDTIKKVLNEMSKRFETHSVDTNVYLGFQYNRPMRNIIQLHQEGYVKRVISQYGLEGAKSVDAPLSLTKSTEVEEQLRPDVPYRQAIGSLMYAAVNTRVDIMYAVCIKSRKVASPTTVDWQDVKRIIRYLKGKEDLTLTYSKENNRGYEVYCDSDFAGDSESSKSTTGAVHLFAGAPIYWRSQRQALVTLSSTEAEYVSVCSTIKDIAWIRKLAIELRIIEPFTELLKLLRA